MNRIAVLYLSGNDDGYAIIFLIITHSTEDLICIF